MAGAELFVIIVYSVLACLINEGEGVVVGHSLYLEGGSGIVQSFRAE